MNKKEISYKDWIILESLVDKYGPKNILFEANKIDEDWGKLAAGLGLVALGAWGMSKCSDEPSEQSYGYEINRPQIEISYGYDYPKSELTVREHGEMEKIINSKIYKEKVETVQKVIDHVYAVNGISPHTQEIDPEVIVYYCEKYNFDLPLALAQAQQESAFGSSPRAKRTKSMFSVGLYDDGRDVCTYDNMNQSVEPYIRLVKRNYMLNGKRSPDDLLEYGQFVNYRGERYAVARTYEQRVKEIRDYLIKKYPILTVQCS